MSITKESDKAMFICQDELNRKVTPDEAMVSGLSFELGRQFGVKQSLSALEESKEQIAVLAEIKRLYEIGDMKNLMLALHKSFGESSKDQDTKGMRGSI